jgi:hypothetical protein
MRVFLSWFRRRPGEKEIAMPDDPNKRGKADRSRVSKQEHEQRYAAKRKSSPKTSNNRKKK